MEVISLKDNKNQKNKTSYMNKAIEIIHGSTNTHAVHALPFFYPPTNAGQLSGSYY